MGGSTTHSPLLALSPLSTEALWWWWWLVDDSGGQTGASRRVDAISSGVLNRNQTLIPVGLDHEQ